MVQRIVRVVLASFGVGWTLVSFFAPGTEPSPDAVVLVVVLTLVLGLDLSQLIGDIEKMIDEGDG